MKRRLISLAIAGSAIAFPLHAQTPAAAAKVASTPWTYATKQLDRDAVDTLLSRPGEVLVIDVRRPDELVDKGSFPVYLNVQVKDLEQSLAFIPRERWILTVSNHAHRAGAAGDLLSAKGFKVAGATGSEDYEAQGGKAVVRVAAPAKPVAAK